MDIECKLKREGGSHVDIDEAKYHFAPRKDGAHVAFVKDEAHQDRFLSITEAYGIYRGKAPAPTLGPVAETTKAAGPTPLPAVSPVTETLLGSSLHPATFDINGKTYALGDIVALAQAGCGLDANEWNELEEESRADLIDEQLDKLHSSIDSEPDQSEERAILAVKYKAKFGKAPHGKWSVEKIREQLEGEA